MTKHIPIADKVLLHIIPSDKFTTNIICILIRRPLIREEVTQTALIPTLLSRGSAKYPAVRDIRLAAETLQGSIFNAQIIKKGEQQILQFFLEYTKGDNTFKGYGLDFLREIIRNPLITPIKNPQTENNSLGFHPSYVKSECENLKNRIEGRINNKSEYANYKCLEAMCEGEPFGLYGDGYAEDLPGITPESLLNHYKNIWAGSPVDFIAFGKWDEAWLKEGVVSRFGPFNSPKEQIPKAALHPARSNRQIIRLNHNTAQGNLCIGLRGEIAPVGKDFIHLQLANEILGGGPNAKLFVNIREKESLCYAIFSSVYRFKSLMCIQAGTEPDKLERVLQLAEYEINALKQGDFTGGDLYNAKQSLSKAWRAIDDNPSACVDSYASQFLLEDTHAPDSSLIQEDALSLDKLLVQIEEAKPGDISQAASRLNIDTVVVMQ